MKNLGGETYSEGRGMIGRGMREKVFEHEQARLLAKITRFVAG